MPEGTTPPINARTEEVSRAAALRMIAHAGAILSHPQATAEELHGAADFLSAATLQVRRAASAHALTHAAKRDVRAVVVVHGCPLAGGGR